MSYRVAQRIFVAIAFVSFILSLVLAYLNTAKVPGLYFSSSGYVDDKYYQQVSPIGTVFAIVWPIIYFWNLVGFCYIIVSMFLTEKKNPINVKPTLLPISFFIGHTVSFTSTVGWLFAFDREILELCFVMLFLAASSVYYAIGISYKRIYDNLHALEKESNTMIWSIRILIQNGLCVYATWLTLATHLGLVEIILYKDSFGITPPLPRGSLAMEDGSTIVLSILFALIVLWFILDNFVLEKYTRHTFTVFPVFILGLSGLVAKLRFDEGTRNLTIASCMLGFAVFAFVFRVIYFIYRSKTHYNRISNSNFEMTKQSFAEKGANGATAEVMKF